MAHNSCLQKAQFHEHMLNVSLNFCCVQLLRGFKLVEHGFFCILTINRLEISEKALNQSDIHTLGKFKKPHDKATVDESYLIPILVSGSQFQLQSCFKCLHPSWIQHKGFREHQCLCSCVLLHGEPGEKIIFFSLSQALYYGMRCLSFTFE